MSASTGRVPALLATLLVLVAVGLPSSGSGQSPASSANRMLREAAGLEASGDLDGAERVLREVPDDATVWPGHDYGIRPSSTVALERETNPFLLCADEQSFLDLKRDWSSLKQELGLK